MNIAKTIMIQGTGSHVGKSVITAGLCRMLTQDGYRVAPFKAQNMALNSFVTRDGGEIGTAQAVQAEACGIEPAVEMNPVLLKPNSDTGSQVIVSGKILGNMSVDEYMAYKPAARDVVRSALEHLRSRFDIVVIEGAGSPAETNLRENDIANMGTAALADSPVMIAGDIDRGGVFAWLYGTFQLLLPEERDRVKGFIINKFRGQRSLLDPAIRDLEKLCGRPVVGVIPYVKDLGIAEEDSLGLQEKNRRSRRESALDIVIIQLPTISNFTDFDPLAAETDVSVRYVREAADFGAPDIVIIPGSKCTINDMQFLTGSGLGEKVIEAARREREVIGICGGFQMLGKHIFDRSSNESDKREAKGLGLLDSVTTIEAEKRTFQVEAEELETGISVKGYEIHMGNTRVNGTPVFSLRRSGRIGPAVPDGLKSGNVWGTYIHGLFENDRFRNSYLKRAGRRSGVLVSSDETVFDRDASYNSLADVLRETLEQNVLRSIIGI